MSGFLLGKLLGGESPYPGPLTREQLDGNAKLGLGRVAGKQGPAEHAVEKQVRGGVAEADVEGHTDAPAIARAPGIKGESSESNPTVEAIVQYFCRVLPAVR
ncbi:MAG: hypothetical protein RMJ98_20460 [Myxococcales bacterium]|nr:hypothetical protein [Polyangiaceae bacterium]MDW8251675.1 hypothetical protein [Myxococcales bacterium]